MSKTSKCAICHEKIERLDSGQWRHTHADKDVECGTGDGATAMPSADSPRRNQWNTGEEATFTYSLAFDASSDICTRLHHRSGQPVIVLAEQDPDDSRKQFPTLAERADEGALVSYHIRFPDGHEDDAFEDELTEKE